MIIFNKVSKIYKNGTIGLDDVSLRIDKGEFVFIIGSTGSGKSTMVKAMLREIPITKGNLVVGNVNVSHLSPRKIPYLRRKIGVVFQDFRLFENKTVYENVALPMKIVGESNRKIRRTVPGLLFMMGLEKKVKSLPKELSGGEKQRTAIARAIINRPDILIADEPTGNLDPDSSWNIMKKLEEINKSGTTVVVVTHDKEIVNKMQKRVITLKEGRVIKDVRRGGYTNEMEFI